MYPHIHTVLCEILKMFFELGGQKEGSCFLLQALLQFGDSLVKCTFAFHFSLSF